MNPQDVTLYSGGARGAEALFGEMAEKYGVDEVNFTFEGHHLDRAYGLQTLTSEELTRGDVVMAEVSKRLNRDYSDRPWMRQILQSIWHQVNHGYEVYVVGSILPDGTVKGGTGWAAELAKLYNRPLFVFDQEKGDWFTWKGNAWVLAKPVIVSKTFCGTGTRNLNDAGARAIRELFAASFAG